MLNAIIIFFRKLFGISLHPNGYDFEYIDPVEPFLHPGTYYSRIVHIADAFSDSYDNVIGVCVFYGLVDTRGYEYLVRFVYHYNSPQLDELERVVKKYHLRSVFYLSGIREKVVLEKSGNGKMLEITSRKRCNHKIKSKVFNRFIEAKVYNPEELDDLNFINISETEGK